MKRRKEKEASFFVCLCLFCFANKEYDEKQRSLAEQGRELRLQSTEANCPDRL